MQPYNRPMNSKQSKYRKVRRTDNSSEKLTSKGEEVMQLKKSKKRNKKETTQKKNEWKWKG